MGQNRQPELYTAALIPYVAAAIALVSRLASRRQTRHALVWEDILAVIAFSNGSAFTFISIYKMRWGLGKPLQDVDMPEDEIVYHYFLDLWVDMWFYTFSVGLSKFVILGFYWRTFSLSIIRQPIRILFVCSVVWIIVRVTLISMQCQPIRRFWHKDIPGKCPLTPMLSLFAASIPHFILEVAILLCPLIEIYRLHISAARKIAVAAMFASGLLVCGSALGTIIHTVALGRKNNQDLTFDGIDDQIWAVCDVNLASFATSLPLLRPILRSCGGIFTYLRSSDRSIGPSNYGNPNSVPTFGSAPKRRRSQPLTATNLDTESTIELAGELRGHRGERRGRISALHKNECEHECEHGLHHDAEDKVETRGGVHIRSETKVDFSSV
ncbi:unnamed protein product [Alternaria alternata]